MRDTGRSRGDRSGRRRRLGTAGVAAALAAGLSGCQFASPVTTEIVYNPGEGVIVNVGEVAVRDLLVISQGYGAPGLISGLAVNHGSTPVQVTFTVADAGSRPPTGEVVTPSTHTDEWPPALSVDEDQDIEPPVPLTEDQIALANQVNAAFVAPVQIEGYSSVRLSGNSVLGEEPATEPIPAVTGPGGGHLTLDITLDDGSIEQAIVPIVYPGTDGPYSDLDLGPSVLNAATDQ